MNNVAQAVWVEFLKARRSRMPLLTALGISLLPLVGGFMMIILRDPELARRVGLISAKAQITVGVADWPAFLGFLAMGVAVGGIILFGLIAGWVFGREYSDRTVKDLLALPTSRSATVLAKFVVILAWSAALTALMALVGLGVGTAIGLPPVPLPTMLHGLATLAICALLTIALLPPVAFVASAGHGYLPPVGFMVLAVGLAQVVAIIGYGEYFPWAIPGMISQGQPVGPVSYVIVMFTVIAGMAATLLWWELADQTH